MPDKPSICAGNAVAILSAAANGRPVKVAATAGTTRVVFRELPEGDYAAVIFQDLDGDRRLARNSFGLPLEPWGFTNDAAAPFGPPGFDAARITVAGTGATAVVRLRTQPPEPVAAR